jgi:hypothetical protein
VTSKLVVADIGYGVIDPGEACEIYMWPVNPEAVRCFTIVPLPDLSSGLGPGELGSGDPPWYPVQANLEITRVWSTTWFDDPSNTPVYQCNLAIENIGIQKSLYSIWMSEMW